jgi:hypothetical protein
MVRDGTKKGGAIYPGLGGGVHEGVRETEEEKGEEWEVSSEDSAEGEKARWLITCG